MLCTYSARISIKSNARLARYERLNEIARFRSIATLIGKCETNSCGMSLCHTRRWNRSEVERCNEYAISFAQSAQTATFFSPTSISIYDLHMECRVLRTLLILDLNIISSSRTLPLDLKHFPANATSEFAFYRALHPMLGIKDSNFCIIYKSIGLCNDIELRMHVRLQSL